MVLFLGLLVSACGTDVPIEDADVGTYDSKDQRRRDDFGTLTGGQGFTLFSRGRADQESAGGGSGGIGVNAYLWRASLETIDFMPLASADPFGGLIITDWYQPPEKAAERLKLQVLIRDTQLRADGVKVSVFRQVRDGSSGWADASVDPSTSTEIEDKILTRARQLRVATLDANGS